MILGLAVSINVCIRCMCTRTIVCFAYFTSFGYVTILVINIVCTMWYYVIYICMCLHVGMGGIHRGRFLGLNSGKNKNKIRKRP